MFVVSERADQETGEQGAGGAGWQDWQGQHSETRDCWERESTDHGPGENDISICGDKDKV